MRATPRRRVNRPLQVETLESVTLLSGLTTGLMAPPALIQSQAIHATVSIGLSGTTRGSFTYYRANPDTGTQYNLYTGGVLAGLGGVSAVGTVRSLGNVAQGQAQGHLTIYTGRGAIYVYLAGPVQSGHSPLPTMFYYGITGGTGKWAGATGFGTVNLALQTFPYQPSWIGSGLATLHFKPA